MAKREWEVIPNYGQVVLEGISRDSTDFFEVAGEIDTLSAVTEEVETEARRISGLVVDTALAGGDLSDLDRLVETLQEDERLNIVQAYLARYALDRILNLRKGREYDGRESVDSQLALMAGCEPKKLPKRAEVTAIKSGVLVIRRFDRNSRPGPNEFFVQVPVDTKLEGKIIYLGSQPEEGGRIVLGRLTHYVHLSGLVNPVNGEPRVQLEILTKNT